MGKVISLIQQHGVLQMPQLILGLIRSRCFSFLASKTIGRCGKRFNAHYTSRIIGVQDISIGDDFFSGPGLWLEAVRSHKTGEYSPTIEIGSGVAMNTNVHLACVHRISIGNNSLLASNIFISDHNHGIYQGNEDHSNPSVPPNDRTVHSPGDVIIGENCWIGENVAILPGSNIGNGAVIGANAVVTGKIPPYCIAVGSPARVIKEFDLSKNQWVPVSSGRSEK